MAQSHGPQISAGSMMREAASSLTKPPFRALLILAVFVSVVANTLPVQTDEMGLLTQLVLMALGLYLQIALTLAAADPNPTPSVEVWVRTAFARRCFWRYIGASVLAVLSVLAGALALVVGAFVVGGMVALTGPAVVLERKGPVTGIARSAAVGRPARTALIVIFSLLILIPGLSIQIGALVWDLRELAGPVWPVGPVILLLLGLIGTIALTRSFVALGGEMLPNEERKVFGGAP